MSRSGIQTPQLSFNFHFLVLFHHPFPRPLPPKDATYNHNHYNKFQSITLRKMADAPKSPTPPAKSKRKASGDSDGSPTRKAKAPKLTANDYSNGNDRGFIKPLRPRRQRVCKIKSTLICQRMG